MSLKSPLPAQIRAGRALVGLTIEDVAHQAGVAASSVADIEAGQPANSVILAAVAGVLYNSGVEFLFASPEHGPGVRIIGNRPQLKRMPRALDSIRCALPFWVEINGMAVEVLLRREYLDDLPHDRSLEQNGRLPDMEYCALFDKHLGEILDGVRRAFRHRPPAKGESFFVGWEDIRPAD